MKSIGQTKKELDTALNDIDILRAQVMMLNAAVRDLTTLLITWATDEELDDLLEKLAGSSAHCL